MEAQNVTRLARNLGMNSGTYARHFRNLKSYLMLEEGIVYLLKQLKGANPKIRTMKKETVYSGPLGPGPITCSGTTYSDPNWYQKVETPTFASVSNFNEAVRYFIQNYGIGCEPMSQEEIARDEGVSRQTIHNKISFVTKVLKERIPELEGFLVE